MLASPTDNIRDGDDLMLTVTITCRVKRHFKALDNKHNVLYNEVTEAERRCVLEESVDILEAFHKICFRTKCSQAAKFCSWFRSLMPYTPPHPMGVGRLFDQGMNIHYLSGCSPPFSSAFLISYFKLFR